MQPLGERVLTVPEAALLCRVATRTYYAAAARGEVPSVRIGRRLVVPGAALARFLESVPQNETGSATDAPGEVVTTLDVAAR